ncbi:GNAT family N-acetyltransferase [Aquimarina sp. W85]|uniref:GNAT family N-acetyltransferase n=1 Tax=Aquimarina rhodophyticola TaxID=3342246 RepID=UPI003672FDE1
MSDNIEDKMTPDKAAICYSTNFPDFGSVSIRPFDLSKDADTIYEWVNQEYALYWGMIGCTLREFKEEYHKLLKRKQYQIFIGIYKHTAVFLLEKYHPQYDVIGTTYDVKSTDCGMHVLVAPPRVKIPHFTWYLFNTITNFIFEESSVDRILVEPDIHNKKMFALCERIGFVLDKVVELPHKTAQLAFLEKEVHSRIKNNPTIQKRTTMNTINNAVTPQQSIAHISSKNWEQANRLLVKKAITEFAHELLIKPVIVKDLKSGWKHYLLTTDKASVSYEFKAKPLALQHLWIDEMSITKVNTGEQAPLDAVLFIKEVREQLGIAKEKLPLYLEEIISTLHGSVFKMEKGNPSALELVVSDFQTIEQSMTEGHPGFVANNGRIGFDSSDYRAYAPETGNSFSLLWLAGHKDKTVYSGSLELSYEKVIEQELDTATRVQFETILKEKGKNPEDYYFIPVHPWQWFNKLATIFSTELASNNLICLGYGADQYLAQQSIRTLFNQTHSDKFYTKTALSILNMGFMRGLPVYYLGTAPKMASYLENLLYKDSFIKETGFCMLSEVASVSYVNPYFEEFGPHNDYNKMLASLWRESPVPKLTSGERAMTMAAFLHIDDKGEAFLPHLIQASGRSISSWLSAYFKAYLSPLLHCFYHFDLVFMPHGENIIMVLNENLPARIFMKDITEEAVILNPDVELPEHLKRMYAPVPEDVKLLSIFTDIFDGFFRYMAQILEAHTTYSENDFWKLVAENIKAYQEQFPEYKEKFERYDLFAPDFSLSCLNRLQLSNHKQMIDLDDPVALLQFAGRLENPIARFKHDLVAQ